MSRVRALAEMGYEYIEPTLNSLRVKADPTEYYAIRRAFHQSMLKPEVFQWSTLEGMSLIGNEVEWTQVERFIAVALERIDECGGNALSIPANCGMTLPEEYPPEEALNQLRYALRIAADYAENITIAVATPAGIDERSDRIDSAVELVQTLGRPAVALLASVSDTEDNSWVCGLNEREGQLIQHVHYDMSAGAENANEDEGGGRSVERLDNAGYDGRLSVCMPQIDDSNEFEAIARQALDRLRAASG